MGNTKNHFVDRSKYVSAKSTTVDGGDMSQHGPQFAIDDIIGPTKTDASTFISTSNMKSPWIEIELSEMTTISAVEVTPVRTNKRYFQRVHIRGGSSSLSLQQDDVQNSVDTSQRQLGRLSSETEQTLDGNTSCE